MGKKIAEQVYALPFHYRDHFSNTEMEMHMDMRKFLCLINRCINTNAVKLAEMILISLKEVMKFDLGRGGG
jgi:hypothetical protein